MPELSQIGPFAGFDTSKYPGNDAMQAWKDASPYSFVGYYLKTRCHPGASWMGTRPTLEQMGWGIAVLYVGRQAEGPCSSGALSRAAGVADALDALQKTGDEGFSPGAVIYLDIEPMSAIPDGMFEYMRGWLSQFVGAGFAPGIYCHLKNADALRSSANAEFPADRISFWVSGSGHFVPGVSRPADSGKSYARIWQGAFNVTKTFGDFTIQIDENVSDAAQPSMVFAAGNVS